jgi:hypothetical protein
MSFEQFDFSQPLNLADTVDFQRIDVDYARFWLPEVTVPVAWAGPMPPDCFFVVQEVRRVYPQPESLYAMVFVYSFYLDPARTHYAEGGVLGYPRGDCMNMARLRIYRTETGSLDFRELGVVGTARPSRLHADHRQTSTTRPPESAFTITGQRMNRLAGTSVAVTRDGLLFRSTRK